VLHMCTSFVMILILAQVCTGTKVLRDWGVLSVTGECLINEVFEGWCMGLIESADGFCLPDQYVNSPVLCFPFPTWSFPAYLIDDKSSQCC